MQAPRTSVIEFPLDRARKPGSAVSDQSAEVLIFTGVRFERMYDLAERLPQPAHRRRGVSQPRHPRIEVRKSPALQPQHQRVQHIGQHRRHHKGGEHWGQRPQHGTHEHRHTKPGQDAVDRKGGRRLHRGFEKGWTKGQDPRAQGEPLKLRLILVCLLLQRAL